MSSPHAEPTGAPQDDPSAAPTAYVTAILVVVFIITVIGLQAYFGRVESEEQLSKVVAPEVEALVDLRAEQRAKLAGYRWVAPDSGVVAVPVERAKALVAAEFAAKEPLPSPTPPAGE